ncbi:MAG: tRNA epoxyqueuosine(34) reductase QueG [Pseudomonadota bacterium]
MSAALKEQLKSEAFALGLVGFGICKPTDIPQAPERLGAFVDAGRHGQMSWMAERMGWRGSPAALWPESRSVVMVAESYAPESDPLEVLKQPEHAAISVYAQNRDYHDVLKKKLKRLGRWLIDRAGGEIKVFVDTAPVMEKPLAQAAGLGWQGKHTNLLSRDFGNWVFLGALFTTIDLPADAPEVDHCGSCRSCLDICPTDAFPAPYQLDARRCISYLTIEHKGPVDEDLRTGLGNRIYGCDDCLAVCPWNKFAAQAHEAKYHARRDLSGPRLADLATLDDSGFRQKFSGSPIKRIGRNRFVRNVCYAIGNSQNPALRPVVSELTSDADPVVADAARWAVTKLC